MEEFTRILLVEDEQAHGDLILRSLRRSEIRFQTVWVQNLSQAIQEIESSTFDIIVSDFNLPDGDGRSLIERMQNRCPVLMMTSHGNEMAAVMLMKAGAVDYVVKSPESFSDMPRIIERALRSWKTVQEKWNAEQRLREANLELERLAQERANQLQSAQSKYWEVVSTANVVIMRWDEAGTIRFINPFGLEFFGLKSDETIGNNIRLVKFPEWPTSAEDLNSFLEKVLGVGEINVSLIEPVRNSLGQHSWISWTNHVIMNPETGIREILSIGLDNTDQHRLQDELEQAKILAEQASTAKSDFLASMSHEIRTPMNSILGMTHIALESTSDPKIRGYLSKVEDSAKYLLRILNDILDFSKIEAGRLDLEEASFDLEEVLQRLGDLIGQRAQEKGLELLFKVDPDVPRRLIGDPLRIGQVLLNLVSNAVKFTERGEVCIRVRKPEATSTFVQIRFEVQDTGIGIDSAVLPNLFKPFQQGDSSTTRRFGGTGLGLSISKKLVTMMNGAIHADSIFGKGSCFTFDVRLKIDPRPLEFFPDLKGLEGIRILCADDSSTAREILQSVITSMGIRVQMTESGENAVRMIHEGIQRNEPFDVLLLDWKMPGMDGLAVVRALRSEIPEEQLPRIVVMSAYSRDELVKNLQELKLPNFLPKPYSPSQLLDAVLSVCNCESRSNTQPELTNNHQVNLSGKKILVVDDNEINSEVVMVILGNVGAKVRRAIHGKQAIEMIQAETPDLVLMDCQMPVMDGYEATRRLRADSRYHEMPIIAMTASALKEDRAKSLLAGMTEHISKPINVQELLRIVSIWTGNEHIQSTKEVEFVEARFLGTLPSERENILVSVGINVRVAIERLSGEWEIYRNMLSGFCRGQSQSVGFIEDALQKGDRSAAIRHAHTLKGVAAFIGADRLSEQSRAVEFLITDGKNPEEMQLRNMKEDLVLLIAGIHEYLRNWNNAMLKPVIGEVDTDHLRSLLKSFDASAVEIANEFAQVHTGGPWEDLAVKVAQRTQKYDFPGALDALDTWMQTRRS